MSKTRLTLIIPELAGILQQEINQQILPNYLTKIKTKAYFKDDESGLSRLLMNHFSDELLTGTDLPVASLRTNKPRTLCADPCYLYADLDRVLLFSDDLALTDEESTALIAEIQPLLNDFGAKLSLYQTDKWLLELEEMPDLSFNALADVSGRSIDTFLPKGNDRRDWIRLWNEIQMQLHSSKINQQRIADGKVAINSVWFWGQGTFTPKQQAWQSVQGSHPLLEQLTPTNKTFDVSKLSDGEHLWLIDSIDLDADWPTQLQQIDQQILKPVWQQLRRAKLDQLSVQIPRYGTYSLSPLTSWKFW